MGKKSFKIVCRNRKARHRYHLEQKIEAGIALIGPEVKSLREGRADLTDGYVSFRNGEAWLNGVHIAPYPHATNMARPDPLRSRKLLLHKREINKLMGKVQERGYSVIPTCIYFRDGKAKVEIALAKGKKLYDKRESIKRKTIDRELHRKYKIR